MRMPPTDSIARTCCGLQTVGERLACAEIDKIGGVAIIVSRVCITLRVAVLRFRFGLSGLLATGRSIGLAGLLNVGRVKSQSVVPATASVVVLPILSVILPVLGGVLGILGGVLAVLTFVLALTSELSIGNTSCEQYRDECREAHDVGLPRELESKICKRVDSDWRQIREKGRYVQRNLNEELEEAEKRNVTLNWQTSSTGRTSDRGW